MTEDSVKTGAIIGLVVVIVGIALFIGLKMMADKRKATESLLSLETEAIEPNISQGSLAD